MADDWKELPFSEAVLLNPATPLAKGSVYPFVEMSAITAGTRDVKCSEHREFAGGGSRFQDRDTLMARITPCLENGKLARFRAPADEPVGHGSTEFIVIRGRPNVSDNDYAYYLTVSPEVRAFAISQMTGTSGRQRVPTDALGRIAVPVPPLGEQKAIAAVLGALDDKIELNRRMNATLEAMARALFQSWFVDFDPVRAKLDGRPPASLDPATAALFPEHMEDSPLGHIPKGWKAQRLPDAIEVNPRRTLKSGTIAPYLDMKNLPTQGHSAEEVIDREFSSGTKFQNGDTLLARITPCLENGKTGYVDFLEDGQIGWGSTEYIILSPKPPLPPQFGYLLARSDALRTHAIQNMTGTSGRQRVPSECFNTFWLAVPTPAVARRFDELTAPLMAKIKANSNESRTLATLRDTLLPKLLSGELSVAAAAATMEASV
jgi:type I restriction enzyme S subunit